MTDDRISPQQRFLGSSARPWSCVARPVN